MYTYAMFIKNFIQDINDTVDVNTTLQEAVNIMARQKLHHIVLLKDKKPVGIITEKDIVKLFKNEINFNEFAINHAVKHLITLHNNRLAQHALSMMIDNNIRRIIVVNSKDEYLGCIEQEHIVYRFEEELHESKINIHQLLDSNNQAVMIDEESNLKHALYVMTQENLTSLLISKSGQPAGIISESDILHLAQQHIKHDINIKEFMHSPIIKVDTTKSVHEIVHIMKENHIRRMVIHDTQFDTYHILDSKNLVGNLKGSYTKFLESKLYDIRDTFNGISQYVIELLDLKDEQVIYWTNSITEADFNITIDDNITKIIPKKIWTNILKELSQSKVTADTIKIKDRYFKLKAYYGTILENNIIKLFLSDITEETKLNIELQKQNKLQEELLFNQEKMVQMGEMIGNIAHQWRQPLNIISVAATGMQLKKDFDMLTDKEFSDFTESINKNAEYLSNIIDVFRDFIKEKKELKELILQERVDTVLNIVETSLKNKHIKLINKIDYSTPIYIKMVTGELDQVIINIINNAKDILLEKEISDPWIKIESTKKKDKVLITIEDNGGGIPEDIIVNIFDKYFTTKENSQGTGLGLHMSQKIIADSLNGKLYVENTSNGAKFFIELKI